MRAAFMDRISARVRDPREAPAPAPRGGPSKEAWPGSQAPPEPAAP